MEGRHFVYDKDLWSYIAGLAIGDGNLSNPNGRAVKLRISCDTNYPFLLWKVQAALRFFFPNNSVGIAKRPSRCVDVYCHSNYWPALLGWNAKDGSKFIQNVTVPNWILNKESYVINCLRGLIETDGSIYTDHGYPMMMFVTIIPSLANAVMYMIESLNFKPRIYTIQPSPNSKFNSQVIYHIRLSKNVNQFLDLVQPQKI